MNDDSFSSVEFTEVERRQVRRLLYLWHDHGWVVTQSSAMLQSFKRLALLFGAASALGIGISWAVKQGWFL